MSTTYHCRLKPHAETKGGIKIDTQLHYDYIAREGKYANIKNHGEDLRYKCQGNMPPWSKNKAENFWKEAEKHRQQMGYYKNGEAGARAYLEFELGLQMDLSLDDNIACVNKFLVRTGIEENHAYSYGIHERPARFDEDLLNIHVHIMFDERTIEPDRILLTPEDYFKRYSKNKEGKPVGGYKKDRRFNKKEFLLEARRIWAEIVNEKLAERGLDEQVSHETLEKQQRILRQKGEHELADTMNREPPANMEAILRSPRAQEDIKKKITDYEKGIEDDKTLEEMSYYERKISQYAKDYVIRKAARKIQQERMKQQKDFSAQLEEESASEILNSPVVITIGDITDYFKAKKIQLELAAADEKERYQQLKKEIIKEEHISANALNRMTHNEYQRSYKAYKAAVKLYKAEESVDEANLLRFDKAKFIDHIANLRHLRQDAEKKRDAYREIRTACMETHKDLYEKTVEKIKLENQDKEKKIRVQYGKIKSLEKEIYSCDFIIENFSDIDPEVIIFSETLPRQLSRKDRIDGITPVKKLEACSYKGNIYYIIDGEKEHVKAVKLNDDVIDGKVPVYAIERSPFEDRYKINKVTKTEEEVKLYRSKKRKPFTKAQQKANEKAMPKIEKAAQAQEERTANALGTTVQKIMADKEPAIRLRWHEKDDHKLSEMEQIEKQMYQNWHPAYPPRTK